MSPALLSKIEDISKKGGVRVLAVSGASGGHIFPTLSFLATLKEQHKAAQTLLVLPKRSLKNQLIPQGYRVKYISTPVIELHFSFKFFIGLFNLVKAGLESLIILLEFRPDIVVGFGSLNSVSMVLLAWIGRIKTLIHEQNVYPGRANRLLARFADRIAISFPETKNYLKINQEKIVLTGNPLRQELKRIERSKALSFFGFSDNKFTILVMGGSSGSHRINMVFLEALSKIDNASRLQVIHIAGIKDLPWLRDSYKGLNIKVEIFSFLDYMQNAYSISDLALCRAGATTIAELIFFKIPALLIPYPFAYRHQLSNAKFLAEKNCAILMQESELDDNILRQELHGLINSPDKISLMRSGYDSISLPDANVLLTQQVSGLMQ